MGNKTNKQQKSNLVADQSTVRRQQKPSDVQSRNQSNRPQQKGTGCCGGCFGPKKQRQGKSKVSGRGNGMYAHDTRKSSIVVKSQPNAKVEDKLFGDRQKQFLEIKMRRAQPYELLKDSDYFDSQINDKSDIQRLKKVYDNCQIANYQTPQTQKLQTVQIKTYLFDRNLAKIDA